MKKLAIIGGGRMAGIFSKNAHQMNIETHCFSPIDGVIDKNLFDKIYDIDILKLEEVLEICKKIKIDGVVATTELTIAPAAYIAENMKLPGIPYEIAKVITDKYRNREVTKSLKELKNPKYKEIYNKSEILPLDFKFPIILKPVSKGGKRGVTVIKNKDEIENAFDYALKESGNSRKFILEEFIEGEMECSVESLTCNGKNYIIQVTEKITSGPPHCVELEHHQPANISNELRKKIENAVDKGLKCIGIKNGPCHTEIKIEGKDIYLIEFNARPGGDHIAYPLTELSTGYPYIKGAIQIALGEFEPIDTNHLLNKCAGVLFVTEQTKELKQIFDKCENHNWCYKKNFVSDKLDKIIHNDGFNKNYFIYCDDTRPIFK